jgi:hypothetical protein
VASAVFQESLLSTGLRRSRKLRLLQRLHLEHDHGFVDGLEQAVGEAGAAVEEAALEERNEQELDEGPGGQSVEELLLVKAARFKITLEKIAGSLKVSWLLRFSRICWALNERKG